MEEKNFKKSFSLLWQGIKMLSACACIWTCKSFRNACIDLAHGIVHHPIVALIFVAIIATQSYYIIEARQQRDRINKKLYKAEVTRDSALVFLKDTAQFKQYYEINEKRNK